MALANVSLGDDDDDTEDENETLAQLESQDPDADEEDGKELETSDETDDPSKPEVVAKRKRKLRLKRLRRKATIKAYEFGGGTDVIGIVFLEISRITDLPPEKNCEFDTSEKA